MTTSAIRFVRNLVCPGVEITKAPSTIRADWNVAVKVRDGTTLRVNIFRPFSESPVPVIMSAHPYGKDKIPAKSRSGRAPAPQTRVFPQPHSVRISEWTSWEAPDPVFWASQGYAVVNADLRGGGKSDGVADLFSDQEAQDYYDLIEWAGTQSWSSGRVGLDGVSYLAISQYKVAALRPPHLAAICPWEGLSDLYRDFARPGGVREDGFSVLWSALTRRKARVRSSIRKEIVERSERDEWYRSSCVAAFPITACARAARSKYFAARAPLENGSIRIAMANGALTTASVPHKLACASSIIRLRGSITDGRSSRPCA